MELPAPGSTEGSTGASTGASTSGLSPLGAGFLGGIPTPTPEATVSPERGSWNDVEPPAGYRVVVIVSGDDAATATLRNAVTAWAAERSVSIDSLNAVTPDDVATRLNEAVALQPDLVVGVGDGVVSTFMLLTAQNLGQQFLMIGAELPEPTANVTSLIWPGASPRELGLGLPGEKDPATFTAERGTEAVSAGVASVLHGLTGIVINLPA